MVKKTLIVPSLDGQYKLWKNDLVLEANEANEIYQLGNLISINDNFKDKEVKGPNRAILGFIDLFKSTTTQWHQIIGTNEITALNFPDNWTNKYSLRFLKRWWFDDGFFKVADVSKNRLVTHGGLTYGEWVNIGRPETAREAAGLLNEKYAKTLYQGECFKLGNGPNYAANPIWSDPYIELYNSWLTTTEVCPFNQLHGSAALNRPFAREMINSELTPLFFLSSLSFRKWGSIAQIKGAYFTAVDLDLEKTMLNVFPKGKSVLMERSSY